MKKELFKYLVVALIAIGGGPAGAALWQWSLVPLSNQSADPTVAWVNGQLSSQTEPSGRAMMARLAEYRDDISGSLATGGTSTAYTLTTNASNGGAGICGIGTAPTNGHMIAITPNVSNGANPTITIDSCAAASIARAPGAPAEAGTLIAGTPYSLTYSTAATAWVLRDFYVDPLSVPLGGMIPYSAGSVPNSNFILPAGQCLSTTTFASYWALLGSPGVGSCSAGQFPVIDLRGRVPAALDNMGGSAASRMTAAGCGNAFTAMGALCSNAGESETLTLAQIPTGLTAANASQSITVTGPNGHTIYGNGSFTTTTSGAGGNVAVLGSFSTSLSFTGSNSISMTSTNTGATAHPNVQPSIAVSYLLRVK